MATNGLWARPLYLQVRDALVKRIAVGDWKPGALIPNEGELAREFGVSPGTMRKALELMEGERHVTRRQGRGTFVNDPWSDERTVRIDRLRSVGGEKISDRPKPAHITEGEASEMECVRLKLQERDPVYRIRRVRIHDDQPCIVEAASMPVALFPGFVDKESFSNGLLASARERGMLLGTAEERVSLGTAPADVARDLNIAPGTPTMVLDRVVLTLDGVPIEWRVGWCRSTQYEYFADVD
jgi:GntR family transcriptional regulator